MASAAISSSIPHNDKILPLMVAAMVGTTAVAFIALSALAYYRVIPTVNPVSGTKALICGGVGVGMLGVSAGLTTFALTRSPSAPPKPEIRHKALEILGLLPQSEEIREIRGILSKTTTNSECAFRIERAGKNHHLHTLVMHEIAKIKPTDDKVKGLWKNFLDELHGKNIEYPDGRAVALDMQPEYEYLTSGQKRTVVAIGKKCPYTHDFCSIYKIILESFAGNEIGGYPSFDGPKDPSTYILAKDNKDNLVGIIKYKPKEDGNGIHIEAVARKPKAAAMGVGVAMMRELPNNVSTTLNVRSGNEKAKALYTKFGFKFERREPNYYTCPNEDAEVWARSATV